MAATTWRRGKMSRRRALAFIALLSTSLWFIIASIIEALI